MYAVFHCFCFFFTPSVVCSQKRCFIDNNNMALHCSEWSLFCNYIHVGKLIKRATKSKHQLSALRTSFNLHNYPNKSILMELAFQTGLSEGQVSKWFEYARQKKRQSTCELSLSLSKFSSWKCCIMSIFGIRVVMSYQEVLYALRLII